MTAVEPPAWTRYAACAGKPVTIFFPSRNDSALRAKAVCRDCEVRTQCLEHALTVPERFGIWGGLSERQRRIIRNQRRVKAGDGCSVNGCVRHPHARGLCHTHYMKWWHGDRGAA